MKNACQLNPMRSGASEPFDDRIDTLFRELELATKWQRPSVLFAIYRSEEVHTDAVAALEKRLCGLGQNVYEIDLKDQEGADISVMMSEMADLENVVFFVDGFHSEAGKKDDNAYRALDNRQDFFVENRIRVVFWLTEDEAVDLAHDAPDYWASRHLVIELIDFQKAEAISPNIMESAWEGIGEAADAEDDLDAKIALRTALLTDLPEGNESTATRANLALTLGMLHWRKGDLEKADQFLRSALELASPLQDKSLQALCYNAIALVKTNQGKNNEAIRAYQKAIELAPEQVSTWSILGNLYRKQGQTQEALSAYQKAVEHNPADMVSWNGLGELYLLLGRNEDAVACYLKAVELSPNHAFSWNGLGNTYQTMGQTDDALDAHQKAIEFDGGMIDSWLALGDIYRTQKNHENAKLSYQTAIELDPQNTTAWRKLAAMDYSLGEDDEALHAYDQVLELDDADGQVYSNMASIHANQGRLEETIPLLKKGIALSDSVSEKVTLWNRLGDAYRKLNEYDKADAAYQVASQLDPEAALSRDATPSVAETKTDSHSKSAPGKPESAFLQWLESVKEEAATSAQAKKSAKAEAELPWLKEQAEKDAIAETTAKTTEAVRRPDTVAERHRMRAKASGNPSRPATRSTSSRVDDHFPHSRKLTEESSDLKTAQIWNELGSIYLNTGAYDEAIQAFNRASELDPNYAWTYNNLAAIYFQRGHFSEAALLYQKAIRLLGENQEKALLWNRLGDTYRKLKENNNAAVAYQKAAELDPSHVSLLARARLSLSGNHRA